MADNRQKTSQNGQILTRKHFILLVYFFLTLYSTALINDLM